MNITNILQHIKQRLTSPSLYGLELGSSTRTTIYVTISYSLEEALNEARMFIVNELNISQQEAMLFKLQKYQIRKLDNVLSTFIENTSIQSIRQNNSSIPKETISKDTQAKNEKNKLMKKIIDTKDVRLFNYNIHRFTEAEQHLLKVKLDILDK